VIGRRGEDLSTHLLHDALLPIAVERSKDMAAVHSLLAGCCSSIE
jgi:hypothetical protein